MCASLILLGVGTLIASQLAILAGDLPHYRYNITEKIQSLRGAASGGGILGRISDTLKDLSNDIAKPTELPSKAEAPAKSLGAPGPLMSWPVRSNSLSPLRSGRLLLRRLKSSRQLLDRCWPL